MSLQFNVSRNTIRAVLNRMNVLGILETRRGDGTYLKGIGTEAYINTLVPSFLTSSEDLMSLMMFRRGIEVSSARLAAINATDQDLRELDDYFSYLEGREVKNDEFAQATSDFHYRIAVTSKNGMIVRILQLIRWIITSKMADFLLYKPDVGDSSYYHWMIFRCIKQRKPDEAAYLMDSHMKLLIGRVEDYLQHCKEKDKESAGAHESRSVINIFKNREDNYHE